MPFATNGTVKISWQEQGSGTPVLLVMGHAFSSDMWYPVIPELTKSHRVVWFDNRGTGDSDAPKDATISDLAADARAVMDAAGLTRAHVFGVSMGGGVAMQLAYESPERVESLVLGCTALKSGDLPTKKTWQGLAYYLPLRWMRGALGKSLYGPACPPDDAERDLDRLMKMKYSPRGVLAQVKAMQTYDLTADKVATLRMPALVLHGDADVTVEVRRAHELAATLPDNRLVIYPGAGHNFIVTARAQANADVIAFLSEVDAAAAVPDASS
jgi:pimeloyl-ACP methyl ester carboxylesterase